MLLAILFHPRVLMVLVLLFGLALATRVWRQRSAAIVAERPDHPQLPASLLAGGSTWVMFTTPYCASCGQVAEILGQADPTTPVVRIDATERTDLAHAFSVRSAPTVLLADAAGVVRERLVGVAAVRRHISATAA
ncbi:MAG TPA: protein disulfide isomerase family protein [Acidimicrobiales bacterium]|jgi:hypothetical protein